VYKLVQGNSTGFYAPLGSRLVRFFQQAGRKAGCRSITLHTKPARVDPDFRDSKAKPFEAQS